MDGAVPPLEPIRIYEDYEYVVDRTIENITYFSCKFGRLGHCYGRGKSVGEEFRRTAIHNHAPTENPETIAIFKRVLRNACLTQFRNQRDIYEELRPLYPEAAMTVTYAAIESSMSRWCRLVNPNVERPVHIPLEASGGMTGDGFPAPEPPALISNHGGNGAGAEEADNHVMVVDYLEEEAMDVRDGVEAEEDEDQSNPPPRIDDDDERQVPLPGPIADVIPVRVPHQPQSSVLVERDPTVRRGRRRRRKKEKVKKQLRAPVPVPVNIENGIEPLKSASYRQARNKRRRVLRNRAKARLKSGEAQNAALQPELAAVQDEA